MTNMWTFINEGAHRYVDAQISMLRGYALICAFHFLEVVSDMGEVSDAEVLAERFEQYEAEQYAVIEPVVMNHSTPLLSGNATRDELSAELRTIFAAELRKQIGEVFTDVKVLRSTMN